MEVASRNNYNEVAVKEEDPVDSDYDDASINEEEEEETAVVESVLSGLSQQRAKKKAATTNNKKASGSSCGFKKAPDAPKRFKSAYILYCTAKHKEIKQRLMEQGKAEKTIKIAKMVSEEWQEISPEEREKWEELSDRDKARYEAEKLLYNGPWKIPANTRARKDPSAPKRPMSAGLAFSNVRRTVMKKRYPNASNAELSRLLSQSWKEAPPHIRERFIKQEAKLREEYKQKMAIWTEKNSKEKKTLREQREAMAIQVADLKQQKIEQNAIELYKSNLAEGKAARARSEGVDVTTEPATAAAPANTTADSLVAATAPAVATATAPAAAVLNTTTLAKQPPTTDNCQQQSIQAVQDLLSQIQQQQRTEALVEVQKTQIQTQGQLEQLQNLQQQLQQQQQLTQTHQGNVQQILSQAQTQVQLIQAQAQEQIQLQAQQKMHQINAAVQQIEAQSQQKIQQIQIQQQQLVAQVMAQTLKQIQAQEQQQQMHS